MGGLQFFPDDPFHQSLHHLHVSIVEKVDWYRSWHARPHTSTYHWAALSVYLFGVLLWVISASTATARSTQPKINFNIRSAGVEYGRSVRGNPLTAYYFGSGPTTIWFVGGIHGNEKSSNYVAVDLANYLVDNPGEIPLDRRVIVIPATNPDGFLRSSRTNARKVDLNRNFGATDWRPYSGGPRRRREFAGRSPFSERESKALRDLMEREGVTTLVALHARGNLVNPESSDASRALATRIGSIAGYRYLETWGFYPTTGTLTLWTQERFEAAAVTLELSDYTNPDWDKNRPAFLDVIQQ